MLSLIKSCSWQKNNQGTTGGAGFLTHKTAMSSNCLRHFHGTWDGPSREWNVVSFLRPKNIYIQRVPLFLGFIWGYRDQSWGLILYSSWAEYNPSTPIPYRCRYVFIHDPILRKQRKCQTFPFLKNMLLTPIICRRSSLRHQSWRCNQLQWGSVLPLVPVEFILTFRTHP